MIDIDDLEDVEIKLAQDSEWITNAVSEQKHALYTKHSSYVLTVDNPADEVLPLLARGVFDEYELIEVGYLLEVIDKSVYLIHLEYATIESKANLNNPDKRAQIVDEMEKILVKNFSKNEYTNGIFEQGDLVNGLERALTKIANMPQGVSKEDGHYELKFI